MQMKPRHKDNESDCSFVYCTQVPFDADAAAWADTAALDAGSTEADLRSGKLVSSKR